MQHVIVLIAKSVSEFILLQKIKEPLNLNPYFYSLFENPLFGFISHKYANYFVQKLNCGLQK